MSSDQCEIFQQMENVFNGNMSISISPGYSGKCVNNNFVNKVCFAAQFLGKILRGPNQQTGQELQQERKLVDTTK